MKLPQTQPIGMQSSASLRSKIESYNEKLLDALDALKIQVAELVKTKNAYKRAEENALRNLQGTYKSQELRNAHAALNFQDERDAFIDAEENRDYLITYINGMKQIISSTQTILKSENDLQDALN